MKHNVIIIVMRSAIELTVNVLFKDVTTFKYEFQSREQVVGSRWTDTKNPPV